jgi:hypothetical protein
MRVARKVQAARETIGQTKKLRRELIIANPDTLGNARGRNATAAIAAICLSRITISRTDARF